jgi:transposase
MAHFVRNGNLYSKPTQPADANDVNEAEWALLAPLIPPSRAARPPAVVDVRRIVNVIFYVLLCAPQWPRLDVAGPGRYVPREYSPWRSMAERSIDRSASGVWMARRPGFQQAGDDMRSETKLGKHLRRSQ